MAYYLVTAKPKEGKLAQLEANLLKKAYAKMRPFGFSMTYALENARVGEDGAAVWEEEDYCRPSLAMERAAALDEFFTGIEVEYVEEGQGWQRISDLPYLFGALRDRTGEAQSDAPLSPSSGQARGTARARP